MAESHYVFLQGGYARFFNRVGSGLLARGHRVTGVNFCFGDQLLWRGKDTINYRGRLRDWPAFIAHFLEREQVTDLVLLGEQRDYHKEAVAEALQRGIRITVTDFGYLRPDWITLERNGMSGNSLFPRDPGAIRRIAGESPPADLKTKFRDSTWNMSVGDVVYSFASFFFFYLFPYYRRSDKRATPLRYFPSMGLQMLLASRRDRRARQVYAGIKQRQTRFFLLPMQLDHDFQITAYSPFDSMDDAIRLVFDSFARQAPADTGLILKAHPWDPGFKNWARLIKRWAREFGIDDRVTYLAGGDLDDMIRNAEGTIMVNSTTGVRALQLGSPVKVLGQAIYDVPGLTHQGDLDDYWNDPPKPDETLVDDFVNAIAARIQIRGVFYTEPGLSAAVAAAVDKLHTQTVGP